MQMTMTTCATQLQARINELPISYVNQNTFINWPPQNAQIPSSCPNEKHLHARPIAQRAFTRKMHLDWAIRRTKAESIIYCLPCDLM